MFDDVTGRLVLVLALLAVASLAWWVAQRRGFVSAQGVLTAQDLGHELGALATFVQFSTPTCATCPQVSRELRNVAASRPGVVHVEVAADKRLDLVRRFGVLRTPTVLLLGPDGALLSRTSGPLRRAQAEAALADHLEAVDV